MRTTLLLAMLLLTTSCADKNADWCAIGGYVHPEGSTLNRWTNGERVQDADLEDLYKKNCGV